MTNPLTTSASRLRLVLSISVALTVVLVVAVVVYGVKLLNEYAVEVNQEVVATENSAANLSNIQTLAQRLEDSQQAVAQAKKIVADSQEYQYQDTIIRDIESFASRAGVSVTSYDFSEAAAAAPAPATAEPAVPVPADAAAPETSLAPAAPALSSRVVTVSLETPVNYRNFLNFLNYIEQNLTKMQIANVNLSRGETSSTVNTDALEIEVYVR